MRCEGMRKKVGLCLRFVRFYGSDEDGTEIGGCGRRLGHADSLVLAKEFKVVREFVDATDR